LKGLPIGKAKKKTVNFTSSPEFEEQRQLILAKKIEEMTKQYKDLQIKHPSRPTTANNTPAKPDWVVPK
jgi:hypothetical protein